MRFLLWRSSCESAPRASKLRTNTEQSYHWYSRGQYRNASVSLIGHRIFIFGIVARLIGLLRTESFVKRIVQYTDYVDIQVETVIAYPENSEFKWMKNASYLWLAPMLRYTYTLYANQKYGVDVRIPPCWWHHPRAYLLDTALPN